MIAVLALHLIYGFRTYMLYVFFELFSGDVDDTLNPEFIIPLVFFDGFLPIISLCAAIRVKKRKLNDTS
jgi:hypothetical protein